MSAIERYIPLGGRALLALIFLLSGFGKVTGFAGTVGYMEAYGMPMASFLLVGAIIFELGGGLSLLLGFKARLGALALIIFTIPATLIFHAFWSVPAEAAMAEQINFLKNIAIIGGLLMVVAYGSGPLSLDKGKA